MEQNGVKIKRDIVISSFNTIDYYEFGKDFYQMPDAHSCWEMVYVDKGEIIANYDGIGHTLAQGQAVFHKPGISHSHISNKLVSNNMLVISFASDSESLNFFIRKIFTLSKASVKILSLFLEECKNTFGDISGRNGNPKKLTVKNTAEGSLQLIECYFVEFLYSLIRSDSSRSLLRTSNSREIAESSYIELLKSYLADNIGKALTLDDICRKFCISKSGICKKWKDSEGRGIIEYLISLKMAEAKRLIRDDEHNITEIADMLGYSNIHHFSRIFKKETGFSPMAYKKSVK